MKQKPPATTVLWVLVGLMAACQPVPQTRPKAEVVESGATNRSGDRGSTDSGSADGRGRAATEVDEENVDEFARRYGLDDDPNTDPEAPARTPQSEDSAPPEAVSGTGERIEITCGSREGCQREAKRHCPRGYHEVSRDETAKKGWRPLPAGFGPTGSTPSAGQSNTGSYEPGSPVPQTRLVIECR